MPHYFYKLMEKTLVGRTKLNQLLFLAAERLMYTPAFQALSLYTLAVFEVSVLIIQSRPLHSMRSVEFNCNPVSAISG